MLLLVREGAEKDEAERTCAFFAMPAGNQSGNKRVRYDTEGGRETGRLYTTPSSFSTESAFGKGCCHSHASRSRKPAITSHG